MESETKGAVQEPQVSDTADQSVSTTGEAESYTADQVRYFAQVEAGKVQGSKDREIAERDKLIGLGKLAAQDRLNLMDRLKELEAAEDAKLDKAGQGDREVYDATQLRKQNVQKAMALAEKEQELNWKALELDGLREVKQQQERLEQVKAIGDEFQLTDAQVAKLAEGGGTPEQMRYWAQEYANFNKVEKLPTPAPAKGVTSGGGDMNWEAIKAGFAKGTVSLEKYTEARNNHNKKT